MAMLHKKLPHLIFFALATNYFNVFMSTRFYSDLRCLKKLGASGFRGGGSNFSNLQELNVEG